MEEFDTERYDYDNKFTISLPTEHLDNCEFRNGTLFNIYLCPLIMVVKVQSLEKFEVATDLKESSLELHQESLEVQMFYDKTTNMNMKSILIQRFEDTCPTCNITVDPRLVFRACLDKLCANPLNSSEIQNKTVLYFLIGFADPELTYNSNITSISIFANTTLLSPSSYNLSSYMPLSKLSLVSVALSLTSPQWLSFSISSSSSSLPLKTSLMLYPLPSMTTSLFSSLLNFFYRYATYILVGVLAVLALFVVMALCRRPQAQPELPLPINNTTPWKWPWESTHPNLAPPEEHQGLWSRMFGINTQQQPTLQPKEMEVMHLEEELLPKRILTPVSEAALELEGHEVGSPVKVKSKHKNNKHLTQQKEPFSMSIQNDAQNLATEAVKGIGASLLSGVTQKIIGKVKNAKPTDEEDSESEESEESSSEIEIAKKNKLDEARIANKAKKEAELKRIEAEKVRKEQEAEKVRKEQEARKKQEEDDKARREIENERLRKAEEEIMRKKLEDESKFNKTEETILEPNELEASVPKKERKKKKKKHRKHESDEDED